MSTDLFWEPAIGDMVTLKPASRIGVTAFDKYPLVVKRFDDIDGFRLFTCETTGPVTTRTTKSGRKLQEHPCWLSFFQATELMPTADQSKEAA